MKSLIKIVVFCLLILGIHTVVSAQSYTTYWPSYNKTPLADINQVPWVASDNVDDGWDWSLPDGITPAPTSKLIIARNIYLSDQRIKNFPIVNFPSNPVVTHWLNWNDIEPSQDNYNWDGLRYAIDLCTAKGYKSVIRFMTCRTERSAPGWLADLGINTITHPKGDIDYDPADPIYHQHYLDLVADFGTTGIQNRDDVVGLYVGYSSKSWGDEGIGPIIGESDPDSNDGVPHVLERLDAWAAITDGIRHKMVMGGYSNHGLNLGFGIRRGFVEHYMYHTPDDIMGQKLDANNYMYVDENNPLIANNAYNGEENEEYGENWEEDGRFGNSLAAYPYRYFSSNIRLLQMRCNAVLFSEFALMPEMLAWVGQELGRTRQDAPDVWCFLRETYIRHGVNDNVKNFERWLYQRDTPGYETQAVIPIDKNYDSWMYSDSYPEDFIARKGEKIGFAADDVVFPTDVEHHVAIKVSYIDNVVGTLKLVYHNNSGMQQKTINTTGGDVVRTATFFVTAKFDATGFNYDFELQCEAGKEVPVSFVRVIKTVFVSGVNVNPTTLELEVGQVGQLTKTVQPTNASNSSVTWLSSNNSIASVSSSGLVTGVSLGNATITVTTNDGGFTDNCVVNVVPYVEGENLIKNGDFSDGDTGWDMGVNTNKGAAATYEIDQQQAKYVITTTGTNHSQIWLNQEVNLIAGHEYTFTFDAKTDEAPQPIRLFTAQIKAQSMSEVTEFYTEKTYTWIQNTTELVEFQIRMGESFGTIWIDNVSLIDNGSTLSVNETELENNKLINLYPNPVSDKLHVEFLKIDKNREIIIFNSRGQMIHKESASERHKQIDIASLNTTGVLFVKIISDNQYNVYKIIVQ